MLFKTEQPFKIKNSEFKTINHAPFRKALSNIRDFRQAGDFNSAPTGEIHRNQPGPD